MRGAKAGPDAASDPFPLELPAAMFSGPGLLALADLLPVMTAYLDRDLRYPVHQQAARRLARAAAHAT